MHAPIVWLRGLVLVLLVGIGMMPAQAQQLDTTKFGGLKARAIGPGDGTLRS